jgi:hypothetical protein
MALSELSRVASVGTADLRQVDGERTPADALNPSASFT